MDTRTRRLFILKNLIYTLALIAAYVLQETPLALSVGGVKPNLVIAAVVAIAMAEGEFSGGLYGLLGGILCDTAAFHIFGAASILFAAMGCGCGLITVYLAHRIFDEFAVCLCLRHGIALSHIRHVGLSGRGNAVSDRNSSGGDIYLRFGSIGILCGTI